MEGVSVYQRMASFTSWMRSRNALSVYKGTIAYVLGFILVFLRSFDNLSSFPPSFTAMMIPLIVGGAGKSFGSCVQALVLALTGVCAGGVGFVILAKLSSSQVAQGFVFAAWIYGFGLIKARGIKWFPLSLLSILMAFNGIYTPFLPGVKGFSPMHLEEYLKTYCWSAAIVLAVNAFILPISSERELRGIIILSLDHVSKFAHLIGKTYRLDITEEEKVMRDQLAQAIRMDFGLLSMKIADTFVELNYSRFSTADYQRFITRIRRMQQSVLTAHSSLISVEKKDTELFKTKFLPSTLASFKELHEALNATMGEIKATLTGQEYASPPIPPVRVEPSVAERRASLVVLDLQREETRMSTGGDTINEEIITVERRHDEEEKEGNLNSFLELKRSAQSMRAMISSLSLAQTVSGDAAMPSKEDEIEEIDATHFGAQEHQLHQAAPVLSDKSSAHGSSESACARYLRHVFDSFCAKQHSILAQCLSDGQLHGGDDTLRLLEPLPSLNTAYQYKYIPSNPNGNQARSRSRRRRRSWMDNKARVDKPGAMEPAEKPKDIFYEVAWDNQRIDEVTEASHHSLMRVYSFLFSMQSFMNELELLCDASRAINKPGLHLHYFPQLNRPAMGTGRPGDKPPAFDSSKQKIEDPEAQTSRELTVAEALALLEHRTHRRPRPSLLQRVHTVESWLRSPASLFAAKTAAAASIFAILILHPVPRPWFISFGMNGGVLLVLTALQPTLGQGILSFVLQIMGSGAGYIWARICLEVFKNTGGYHFNPYGIAAFLVPYAMFFYYILYNKPQFFVAGILALNGTGSVIITEWLNVEYMHNDHFDSPALRFAKSFTTLGIALGVVFIFQIFILRIPARRTLRKGMGAMLFSQLSYLTLLQALIRAVMPEDPNDRAPAPAIARVMKELQQREMKMQAQLIGLRPLVNFAANEPQLERPFRMDVANKILLTSLIMLDRMREARIAISAGPLPESVMRTYVDILAPYRKRNTQILQLQYYLVASAFSAKAPLLRETPAELEIAGEKANFMHDMLVLARRHARTPEGEHAIRTGSFTRYFHYLVSITSLNEHLKTLEDACKDLFGELEDHLV